LKTDRSLDRAEKPGNFADATLQAATDEASQRSRPLPRSSKKNLELTEDSAVSRPAPSPDQARALASSGNLTSAITAAQRIRPDGRSLLRECVAINDWRVGKFKPDLIRQEARQVALQGTPEALVQAIRSSRSHTANN